MRRARTEMRVAALLALGIVVMWTSSCTDPVAALGGIHAASSGPMPADAAAVHSHRATIPLGDVDDPPVDGKTYATTTDEGHAHTVHLTQAQLTDLQQRNAIVDVLTNDVDVGGKLHHHRFLFER